MLLVESLQTAAPGDHARGTAGIFRIGFLQISSMAAEAGQIDRAGNIVAQPNQEPFVIAGLQRKGSSLISQDARNAVLQSGDFILCHTGRAFRVSFPEPFEMTLFQIPRHALLVREDVLDSVTGIGIQGDSGVASVVSRVLGELSPPVADYDPEVAEMLARNTVDLLATAINELVHRDRRNTDAATDDLVRRVRVFIRKNIAHPDLSPQMIAAAHHVSVRYLHRAFEDEANTVGRLILESRLEECRRDLTRAAREKISVAAIAHRWGFQHTAHFSRSFRSAYGMSPRDWISMNDTAPSTLARR
ncbi:helix-turn-helix domain-containing protein [Streptomyces zaomyceticus]|uniref:helix-turn-helix domain-containing protein n=1 Tax=Streptomyces zaomyceticus TaxID=68286 RepID=UPI0036D06D27